MIGIRYINANQPQWWVDNILFVCVNNGGRSQMAEAFFNQKGLERGIKAHAESAGTLGVGVLHPLVARAMQDAGLSMEGCAPKQVTPDMIARASRIVSLDSGIDGSRSVAKFVTTDSWTLDDPAGLSLARIRMIRDEISEKVTKLLDEVAK
jgi:arsenate reductase (thioredoxin)